MLDAKMIRANPEMVEAALQNRKLPGALNKFLKLDEQRRDFLGQVEEIKKFRNQASQEVGKLKKQG